MAVVAVAALAPAAAWMIGSAAVRSKHGDETDVVSARYPPAAEYPKPRRTELNNNTIQRMGWVSNLNGAAIAYPKEVDRIAVDGRFQTDLTPAEMAAALRISTAAIVKPGAPPGIDPDAELFRAQLGVLKDECKARARKRREEQVRAGQVPDAMGYDWVLKDYSFTLNRLKHPNDEERAVLAAILRAAAEIMPRPGDDARAAGVVRGDLAPGKRAVVTGMLPPEERCATLHGTSVRNKRSAKNPK
jgi:hypothetical protein